MDDEEFMPISLMEFLAKAPEHDHAVKIYITATSVLQDGTPVVIALPDNLLTAMAKPLMDRVSLPGITRAEAEVAYYDEG